MTYIVTAAEIILACAAFSFVVYCIEWKRRDTYRRQQRLVHRNLTRIMGGPR